MKLSEGEKNKRKSEKLLRKCSRKSIVVLKFSGDRIRWMQET